MGGDAIKGIAQTYFDAWRGRDFDRLRAILADDVTFQGPLGTTEGARRRVVTAHLEASG